MWNNREEDLDKNSGAKDKINNNGVYQLKIKEARIVNSTKSSAKAIQFHFENDVNFGSANLWFKKGDGTPNEFAEEKLNKILYLCKLKMEQMKPTEVEKKGKDGTFKVFVIKEFEDKEIIAALEMKEDGKYINIEIREVFDVKSKKTTSEIRNKEEALSHQYYLTRYENAKPVKQPTNSVTTETAAEDDDEFPF